MVHLNKIYKSFILYFFIFERFWYYENFKLFDDINFKPHQGTTHTLKTDFQIIIKKFEEHHIFLLPFIKNLISNLKFYLKMNKEISSSIYEENNNEKIELDSKFDLYFLLLYDVLILTLIFCHLTKQHVTPIACILIDLVFKIFNSLWIQFRDNSFNLREIIIGFIDGMITFFHLSIKFISIDKSLIINIGMLGFVILVAMSIFN